MRFVADFHMHTVSSGHAYSTIEEYVAAAKKCGLKMIAITDHGPAMPGAPYNYHFANMRMIPRTIDGIRVLRGAEANIINDQGDIDISDDEIAWGDLDLLLVTFHPRCGYEDKGPEENTDALIKALRHPRVKIIAHPENPKYPINIKRTVAAARERGVLIEINNSSELSRPGSHDTALEIVKEVKRAGWKVAVGSDSHISCMLGDYKNALSLIKEAKLKASDVINTSEALIKTYLLN
ncbi:MAG TPA: phosphatase [Candidatus Omnitrophota bacterium]|nr:phosphatase [Candidatus Omnitrophota bacterium]